MSHIPEWALSRAAELISDEDLPGLQLSPPTIQSVESHPAGRALARYIMQHEQDPDVLLARKVCAEYYSDRGFPDIARDHLNGCYDDEEEQEIALAAIKVARQ
jgi:hypothetical protein